tara:strand:+ start:59 stop:499 length:441 start_codon:yes stop_codon:yes gene_type:complete
MAQPLEAEDYSDFGRAYDDATAQTCAKSTRTPPRTQPSASQAPHVGSLRRSRWRCCSSNHLRGFGANATLFLQLKTSDSDKLGGARHSASTIRFHAHKHKQPTERLIAALLSTPWLRARTSEGGRAREQQLVPRRGRAAAGPPARP